MVTSAVKYDRLLLRADGVEGAQGGIRRRSRGPLSRLLPAGHGHALHVDWPGEQLTACGYSFPAPGQVTSQGPMLKEGLGRLRFAGEHACYTFAGYMEGALSSGVAAAKRLAGREAAAEGPALLNR